MCLLSFSVNVTCTLCARTSLAPAAACLSTVLDQEAFLAAIDRALQVLALLGQAGWQGKTLRTALV